MNSSSLKPVCLHERSEIATFLMRRPYLHLYGIGDLDDFFWPYTTWFALKNGGQVEQVVLIYTGTDLPVLLGMDEPPYNSLYALLHAVTPYLPRRFYAHFSGDAADLFRDQYQITSHGVHLKMALVDHSALNAPDTSDVVQLSPADLPALEVLYAAAYPGNWFDPRMLETGCYYGIWRGGQIASVAGVHVYSPPYRVAALGNITTHPDHRGKGLCTAVTAGLCLALLKDQINTIGLNVRTDNFGAIHCYEKLGFVKAAEYEEYMLESC